MGADVAVILSDISKMENLSLIFADISHQNHVAIKFHQFPDCEVEISQFDFPVNLHSPPESRLESKVLNNSGIAHMKLPPKLSIILAGYYRIVTRSSHFRNSWVQFEFNIIPVNISNLPNLRYLGLQSNKFFTISRGVINDWAQFEKSHSKNKLIINLTGNTLYCSCADIDTINDAAHIQNINLEGYVCLFPSGEKLGLFQVNIKEMESKCGKNWLFFHMYICYLFVMMAYIIPIIMLQARQTPCFSRIII